MKLLQKLFSAPCPFCKQPIVVLGFFAGGIFAQRSTACTNCHKKLRVKGGFRYMAFSFFYLVFIAVFLHNPNFLSSFIPDSVLMLLAKIGQTLQPVANRISELIKMLHPTIIAIATLLFFTAFTMILMIKLVVKLEPSKD